MRTIFAIAILCVSTIPLCAQTGLKVPPGFEIVEFADGKLANDIHCMTVDPKGRVVVAGRGYIRILVDDDSDGKADRALDFAKEPKDGAMGLHWEGDTLFAMGDGGLRRFTSKTGDVADGPSTLIRAMKTGGEHAAHAIRRGPDGWLYVLCGNNTGIDASYADLPTSPIKTPTAGAVLRFQPDLKKCEIVAHGFRNPYGMDFNLAGDLFAFDSDNERCVSLPWYEPTRFYHVIEGRHYGWLNPQHAVTWRRPPYFADVVAPVATLGRGSPTGVCCYRHNQFPVEYHGGFFLCDWTFGKVHFAPLERSGASYTSKPRAFLESVGDNGFAPTACAVNEKSGDLYVSIGGRGTRGAVYRVRHTDRYSSIKPLLSLPMKKQSLKYDGEVAKAIDAKTYSRNEADRLWALQMLRRHLPTHEDARPLFRSAVLTNWQHPDMLVRLATSDLVGDLEHRRFPGVDNPITGQPNAAMSITIGFAATDNPRVALERGLFCMKYSSRRDERLPGTRLVQIGLGDIGARKSIGTLWEGYTPRKFVADKDAAALLAKQFPDKDADVEREIARTLAMLAYDDANLRLRMLAKCQPTSSPLEDIHYLACYARLEGKRGKEEATLVATALLDLDRKIAERKLHRDSNWPLRVRELYVGLAEKDPLLHQAMVEHREFGRADHALFANTSGFPKERAARVFLKRWQSEKDFALTGSIVQLFESLPSEDVLPTVRQRWGEIGQESALLPLLARKPIVADRTKFIEGLNSPQASVLEACVQGLAKLEGKADAAEAFALIRALHRSSEKQISLRKTLAQRLELTTGEKLGNDSKRWIAWLEKQHPEFGKRLANPDGVDVGKWDARLAKIDWTIGDAKAGKAVFAKANCATCHSGSQALGPDLVGVTNRFSRGDLFTSILQPSKDVSARYQTTLVETRDGKTYQGIVIYDAVDNLMLQTGASTTVRLDGASVVSRAVTAQSLMPVGLLDGLSDREISDLYAYLRNP